MLQSHDHDECCSAALNAALLAGMLDEATEWTHEECGVTWKPQQVHGLRHWSAIHQILILR
jgi:hypothetical protein